MGSYQTKSGDIVDLLKSRLRKFSQTTSVANFGKSRQIVVFARKVKKTKPYARQKFFWSEKFKICSKEGLVRSPGGVFVIFFFRTERK